MSDFVDFEPAPVVAARLLLRDGRTFVFEAHEGDDGKLHFSAIPGLPTMGPTDLELLVCFERIDAAGRVIESMISRASTPRVCS